MSKLNVYLKVATDSTVNPMAEKLKTQDDRIDELTNQLRQMITESDDEILKDWKFEDEFLVRFIRGRKYNVPSALEKLTNNVHSKRKHFPKVFATLYPSALRNVISEKSMQVLKHRDTLGRQVCIFRPDYYDPKQTSMDDLLRYQIMIVWEMMSSKETQLNGIIIIVDGSGFSGKHLKVLTPHNIQKYVNLCVKCCPTRFKGCHVLYLPHVMQLGMQMAKPFLPEKVRSRLFFHGNDLSVFHKMVPTSILPKWIGGELSDNEAIDQDLEKEMLKKDGYYKGLIQ